MKNKSKHFKYKLSQDALSQNLCLEPGIVPPECWPCYQVSMFRVYKQRHKSWGELYVQSLFWLGSGMQNAAGYREIKNWACRSCISSPTPPIPQPLPSPITTKASDVDPFTILQFNANGIGNKQVELGEFLERHKVGSDSGIEAHLKFSDAKHPELHHSKKRLSSTPRRWFTHIDSQINKLLSETRFIRYSGRS